MKIPATITRRAVPAPRVRMIAYAAAAAQLVFLGGGCCGSGGTFRRAEQVATYGVDATSISRWQDVESDLQPTFKLDEAGALEQVLPTTSNEDVLRAHHRSVAVGVGLASPGLGDTTKKTTSTGVPLDPTTLLPLPNKEPTKTVIEEETKGETPAPVPTAAAPTFTGALPAPASATFGIESRLKYDLATALLQHVRLLNRRVRDAVRDHSATPYVLTVKLNLQPVRRDSAFDAYFDIAFAVTSQLAVQSSAGKERSPMIAPPRGGPSTQKKLYLNLLPDADGQAPAAQTFLTDVRAIRSPEDGSPEVQVEARVPTVLPLLNYDSIEGQLRSSSESEVDAAAFSIAAAYQAVGARVDASDLRAELSRAYGRRNNSLLNIVSLAPNTIRVRLGAAYSPEESGNVMAIREHTISLVVLVPNGALLNGASIMVAARPHLRRVDTGLRLGANDSAETSKEALEAVRDEMLTARTELRKAKEREKLEKGEKTETREEAMETQKRMKPTPKEVEAAVRAARLGDLQNFLASALAGGDGPGNVVDPDDLTDFKRLQEPIAKAWLASFGGYNGPLLTRQVRIDGASLREWPRLVGRKSEAADPARLPPPLLTGDDKQLVLTIRNGVNLQRLGDPTAYLLRPSPEGKEEEVLAATAVKTSADGTSLQAVFPRPATTAPAPPGDVTAPLEFASAHIDFAPPVRVDGPTFDLFRKSANNDPEAQATVNSVVPLGNGRFRILTGLLREGPAPKAKEPEPDTEVTSDQAALRLLPQQPASGLTLRVKRLPADAASEPVFLRLRNARYALAMSAETGAAKLVDGRIQLTRANMAVELSVSEAVPAAPVVVETYRVRGGKEVDVRMQVAIAVSP